MKRAIVTTRQFERDVKKQKKRHKAMEKLVTVMQLLVNNKTLPPSYKNHRLSGDYNTCWECHIEPDWLLIYSPFKTEVHFIRTGTHSDLF